MSYRYLIPCAISGGAALVFASAVAQTTGGGGTLLTARIDSRFEGSDNYSLEDDSPGDAFLWTNTLTFGLSTSTEVDTLNAVFSGDLRYADLPVVGTQTDADNGAARINYQREVDDNAASFSFSASSADLEFLDPLRTLDNNGEFDDTTGSGRRNLLVASAALNLNGDGPIRVGFSANVRDRTYTDVSADNLDDRLFYSIGASVGFDVTDTVEFVVEGDYTEIDEDGDNDDRRSEALAVGVNAGLSPRLIAQARVGYQEVETTENNGDEKTEENVIGSFGLRYAMPNGNLTFNAASRVTANGQRNEVLVGRQFSLPNGSFSGSAGVSNSEGTDLQPLVRLSYNLDGPTSRLSIGLQQSITVDGDGDDRFNAALNANYNYAISPVSSIGLSAVAARREYLNGPDEGEDVTRVSLSAQYNHAVTENWQMSTGYTRRERIESDDDDASANSVFFTLSRTFSARR